MKSEVDFLNNVLAKEFYRLNSGFFLLTGTLTFGFMSGVEHKALAGYFVSDSRVLMIPIGVWLLYALKILSFNNHQADLKENRLLFNISFLSIGGQWFITAVCFAIQFLPALAYGLFLSATAWRQTAYQSIVLIFFALSACCVACTATMIATFRHPDREKKVSAAKKLRDHKYPKPILQFYTEWLLRKHVLTVAGIKIFCGALIWSVCQSYANEDYDWRLIAMALLACSIANLPLAFHLLLFEHVEISWIKNLPLRLTRRYFNLMAVLIIFLIPESVVLIKYFPAHLGFASMAAAMVYVMSLASLLLGFIHIHSSGLEAITKKSFWIFITMIVLILFKVPLIPLSIANLTAGYILFSRNYYLFQPYRGD